MSKPIEMNAAARAQYERYLHACKCMQSGVTWEMKLGDESSTRPKHLRVGVNSALVEIGSLMHLLISKGVFTAEEMYETMAETMEKEVVDYEERIRDLAGKKLPEGFRLGPAGMGA